MDQKKNEIEADLPKEIIVGSDELKNSLINQFKTSA